MFFRGWILKIRILDICSLNINFVQRSIGQCDSYSLMRYNPRITWCFGVGCSMSVLYPSSFSVEVHLNVINKMTTFFLPAQRSFIPRLKYFKRNPHITHFKLWESAKRVFPFKVSNLFASLWDVGISIPYLWVRFLTRELIDETMTSRFLKV